MLRFKERQRFYKMSSSGNFIHPTLILIKQQRKRAAGDQRGLCADVIFILLIFLNTPSGGRCSLRLSRVYFRGQCRAHTHIAAGIKVHHETRSRIPKSKVQIEADGKDDYRCILVLQLKCTKLCFFFNQEFILHKNNTTIT